MSSLVKPTLQIVEESFPRACRRLVSYQDRRKGSNERSVALGRLRILAYSAIRHGLSLCVECATVGCHADQNLSHHFANCRSFRSPEDCYQAKAVALLVECYAQKQTYDHDDDFAYLLAAARLAVGLADDAARGFDRSWCSLAENDELQADALDHSLDIFSTTAGLSRSDKDAARRLSQIERFTVQAMAFIESPVLAKEAGRFDAILALLSKECEIQNEQ